MSTADDRLRELEQRMLRELPASLQQLQQQLNAAIGSDGTIAAEARAAIAQLAHRIRGRAGILQLDSLMNAVAQVEALCVLPSETEHLRNAVDKALTIPLRSG